MDYAKAESGHVATRTPRPTCTRRAGGWVEIRFGAPIDAIRLIDERGIRGATDTTMQHIRETPARSTLIRTPRASTAHPPRGCLPVSDLARPRPAQLAMQVLQQVLKRLGEVTHAVRWQPREKGLFARENLRD